jgi:hypothetical protein
MRKSFLRLKDYTGSGWVGVHSPTVYNRYVERRRAELEGETAHPTLIVSMRSAAIHFVQSKTIMARKIVESTRNPDLVTVVVDLNVKHKVVGLRLVQRGHVPTRMRLSDNTSSHNTLQCGRNSLCLFLPFQR